MLVLWLGLVDFLLDMGSPVKIIELAKSMIRLHGKQPVFYAEKRNKEISNSEIVIEVFGLRPYEKLYEELLISGVPEPTTNPKIFKANETAIDSPKLKKILKKLKEIIDSDDEPELLSFLETLPINYSKPKPSDVQNISQKCISDSHEGSGQQHNILGEKDVGQVVANTTVMNRIFKTKIFSKLLHFYFLFSRAMTVGVRVIIHNQKNEVALVKHSYIGGWFLPGGGVDKGESIFAAVHREVFEETGLSNIYDIQLLDVQLNRYVSERDHVCIFSAKTDAELNFTSSLEIREARFFDLDQLPGNIDELSLNVLNAVSD